MQKKREKLKEINQKLKTLIYDEEYWLANMANASALLFNQLEDINWAGFYILKNNQLILGPFQGKPACVRIEIGKGVCGTAVKNRKTYVVENVQQFPGHIACDEESQSEIVVPIFKDDKILGVLDIDSPVKGRFDKIDQEYMEKFVKIFVDNSKIDI